MRCTLWVAGLLGACDVILDGGHLGLYPKLEIVKKRRKLNFFDVRHVQYEIIKRFVFYPIRAEGSAYKRCCQLILVVSLNTSLFFLLIVSFSFILKVRYIK